MKSSQVVIEAKNIRDRTMISGRLLPRLPFAAAGLWMLLVLFGAQATACEWTDVSKYKPSKINIQRQLEGLLSMLVEGDTVVVGW